MRLRYESFLIGGTPCLSASPGNPASSRGTVVVFHGLYSCKEDCRDMITAIAREGFSAVAVDSVGHGARPDADPRRRIVAGSPDFQEKFMEVMLETAGEFPDLLAGVGGRGYPVSGGIGVAGVSMGGGIVYELLVRECPVRAAAALISSPAFRPDHPQSPHRYPERVPPTALLTVTAGLDTTVPPAAARSFHEALLPLYRNNPDSLREIRYPDSEHLMRPEDWVSARRAMAAWFARHLN